MSRVSARYFKSAERYTADVRSGGERRNARLSARARTGISPGRWEILRNPSRTRIFHRLFHAARSSPLMLLKHYRRGRQID